MVVEVEVEVEVKVEVESNLGAPLGQPLLAGVAVAPWVAGGPQSTGAGPFSSSPCLSSSSLLESPPPQQFGSGSFSHAS